MQILDSHYEKKNTQNEDIIAHFKKFFTCHYSETEVLKEIFFTHVKQKCTHSGKVTCFTEINIILTEVSLKLKKQKVTVCYNNSTPAITI